MKRTVYVLGNPIESLDRAAVNLIPRLIKSFPHINFVHFDPTEELPLNNKDLIIIDTVIGIKKVTKFEDLDDFYLSSRNSVHDYDLYTDLQLLRKLKKIQRFTIIGIPPLGYKGGVIRGIKKYLKNII